MDRLKQWGVVTLTLLLGLLGIGTVSAHAQSLDYAALKYGTNKTSMASGYFVHPATVRVQNHAYVVTMDLKTAKKLTSWPVKVLAVDGRAPENVRKVKDRAGNSHVYYSFTTTNLKRDITARLAIDVPDVYKAKHKLTFRFKTGNLPALNAAASRSTQTTTAKKTVQKPVTAKENGTQSSAASSAATSQSMASSTAAKSATSSSAASQSTSSRPTTSSVAQSTESAKEADQVPQQKTHWGGLIGGIVAILVLVGGGSWWYFGRH